MSAELVAAFARFKKTLEAARDCHQPQDAETSPHLRGMIAGLNIAINGIDAEIRWMDATTPIDHQGEQQA